MKNKNLFPVILLVIIVLIAIISIITTNTQKEQNVSEINDYTPEEEINSKQLRETIVTLYFLDNTSNSLKSEGKLVDSSELLENPYKTIVQYLIEGPKSDLLTSVFPENIKVLNATLDKNCVTINFSEEMLDVKDEAQKYNIINSIINSLSQLTEVSSIKIQVNGETIDGLDEEYSVNIQKP